MRPVLPLILSLAFLCYLLPASVQATSNYPSQVTDTLQPPDAIKFSPAQATQYIIGLLELKSLWRPDGKAMVHSLSRLVDHYNEPIDSLLSRLSRFEYDSVDVNVTTVSDRTILPIRWLNQSTFFVDTVALEKEPFITKQTLVVGSIDSDDITMKYRVPVLDSRIDSLIQIRDTIVETFIDTLYLQSRDIIIHQVENGSVVPPLLPARSPLRWGFLADSSAIVLSRSRQAIVGAEDSPFYILPDERMLDSLKFAVKTLIDYTDRRDSIQLFISNLTGQKTSYWLTARESELYRFWIKNNANDSITIWIGNPTKHNLTLILEDNLSVERRERMPADDIPITTLRPQRALARLKPLEEIPVFWVYGMASALTLNQTYFSNWARGGENSWASVVDMRASADYTNKAAKSRWINNGRLRYGSIYTKDNGLRTNTDILEFNSQYNRTMTEKIDFSSSIYFKTQVAKGYRYPSEEMISKFLNPGTFTVGMGFEYKPLKETRLNFSPLSYRNTFVLDTANINQRIHGVDLDKRSRQEMGGQLVIRNKISVLNDLNISNNIRLFSGYLEKPENIDVDWEISLDKRINWYFMIRLNLHMIYDDDIKFPVLDRDGEPVLRPDGTPKRSPQMQFKQFLGLTLAFTL